MPVARTTIRASVLAGYPEFLAARGLDAGVLLGRAGICRIALAEPDAELPIEAVAMVMEMAAEQARDPALALRYAESFPREASGVVGYLVLHAPTVREALQSIERYLRILVHPIEIRLREDGPVAVLSWRVPWDATTAREQFVTFGVSVMVLRLRQIAGRDWRPRLVEIDHREPACAAEMARLLGTRIRYETAANSIVVDSLSLPRRTADSDPHLYPILQLAGEAKLRERDEASDIALLTFRTVTDRLSSSPPLLERIAGHMQISPRSLQNRLAREGTSFERIVSEARRTLAERYLRDTDLPLTDIALRLGFSELSAFTRAARGWFGSPPSQVRAERRRRPFDKPRPRPAAKPRP